jgi:hypothetical protein
MTIVSDTPTAALLQDTLNPVRVDQTLRCSAERDRERQSRSADKLATLRAAGGDRCW